jgi:hypothetical protein
MAGRSPENHATEWRIQGLVPEESAIEVDSALKI